MRNTGLRPLAARPGGRFYQACPAPQCGHITVVETFASNKSPHWQA
jgi:hypothetical protein